MKRMEELAGEWVKFLPHTKNCKKYLKELALDSKACYSISKDNEGITYDSKEGYMV